MRDQNTICLSGRFVRDPELKYTASGTAVVNYSLAVNGYKKDESYFFDCVSFGKCAETIGQYCKQGKRVQAVGSIKQERWQDKTTGKGRSKVVIVINGIGFLDGPKEKQIDSVPEMFDEKEAQG